MPVSLQKFVVFFILSYALISPAFAQNQNADLGPAGKFIEELGNQAINVVADKSLAQNERTAKYHDLLRSSFDMQTIGHFVLGRAWNSATQAQRDEYLKLFENAMVKIYGDRLNFYSGEKFQVKAVRKENDKDSVVSSEILHPQGGPVTPVEWRVRETNGKFAVVDVTVEGVSQSVTQRQEYASILQRNGGNMEELLKLMRQRAQEPTAKAG